MALIIPPSARTQEAADTPFDNTDNDFTSDNVQDAIEEIEFLVEPLVVPLTLIFNGTLSNGEFIGYSNLLPGDDTPIVCPITGSFTGFTWSNSRSNCDFALHFRKNSMTATPFFIWSVDNTQTANVNVTPEPFTAGDTIFVEYVDEGTNASDAGIVLKFKA